MDWRIAIEPFTRPLFFLLSRLTRGKTLWVRVIARDSDGGVMLFPGDHVLIFAVDAHEPTQSSSRHEIAEARFFPLDALPQDLNRGSGQRLIEYLGKEAPSADW